MPIATTMTGTIIGASSSARRPWSPKKRVRLNATAAAVPHTVATMATSTPTRRLASSDQSHDGSVKKLVYHCADHPLGGKLNDARSVKLSGTTISDGATSHTATTAQNTRSNARQTVVLRLITTVASAERHDATPASAPRGRRTSAGAGRHPSPRLCPTATDC